MSGTADVLTVADVMARYGLKDRRAARRVMDEAGGFKIGAGLYVRAGDLATYEDAMIAARRGPTSPGVPHPQERLKARPGGRKTSNVREPLRPGWWRSPADGGSVDAPSNSKGEG